MNARSLAVSAALVFAALATPNVFATSLPILIGGGVLQLGNLTGQLVGVTAGCINWGQPAACQTVTGIQDTVSGSDSGLFQVGSMLKSSFPLSAGRFPFITRGPSMR